MRIVVLGGYGNFGARICRGLAEDAALTAPSVAELPPTFTKLFRIWFVLGIPAFACVVALVFMMVVKPLAVV